MTVAEALALYLASPRFQRYAPNTRDAYAVDLRRIAEHLGRRRADVEHVRRWDFTAFDVQLRDAGASPAARRRSAAAARSWMTWVRVALRLEVPRLRHHPLGPRGGTRPPSPVAQPDLAARLLALLARRGWSKGHLAEHVGVHRGSLSRWLADEVAPRGRILQRVVDLLAEDGADGVR